MASKPETFTFKNSYPTQRVRLGKGETIQFREGTTDDQGRMQGVYTTTDPAEAQRLRDAIRKGGVPAWEEDQEEREATQVLAQRRERAAARLAEQARAAASKAS